MLGIMVVMAEIETDLEEDAFDFPKEKRLQTAGEFDAVFAAKVKVYAGPLMVHGRLNGAEQSRLGLSIARRVGNAVKRNKLKRLLRESFRLLQEHLPQGFDIVVSARPHQIQSLAAYQDLLLEAVQKLEREWQTKMST